MALLIKSIEEIIDPSKLSKEYVKAINMAIFEKSTSIQRVKPEVDKKVYPVSKNNIDPTKERSALHPIIQHINSFKLKNVHIELLHAGLSVKVDVGKLKRNMFSLRHPRYNRDGNVYSAFVLNCVVIDTDLMRLDKISHYETVRHEKYFKILNMSMQQAIELLTLNNITEMVNICQRIQRQFKKRKNVY